MTITVRHLSVRCERCGTPPRLRQTDRQRLAVQGMDPDDELLQYQCHKEFKDGRICGHIYPIRVRHFVQAP